MTAWTKGSPRTPSFISALRISAWVRSEGEPASAEIATIQRRPVQSASFFESSPIKVLRAPASSAISRVPSSKRTSRTSRSRALLIERSRFSAARLIRSAKFFTARICSDFTDGVSAGAAAETGRGAAAAADPRALRAADHRGGALGGILNGILATARIAERADDFIGCRQIGGISDPDQYHL